MQVNYTWRHALDEISNGGFNQLTVNDEDQLLVLGRKLNVSNDVRSKTRYGLKHRTSLQVRGGKGTANGRGFFFLSLFIPALVLGQVDRHVHPASDFRGWKWTTREAICVPIAGRLAGRHILGAFIT